MSYYNWEKILKNKTNEELVNFIKHNPYSDVNAKLEAIYLLEQRGIKKESISELYKMLLEELKLKQIEINKKTLKEEMTIYSPYILFFSSIISLFQFAGSGNNIYLISFIGFITIGIINLFSIKSKIKSYKEERKKENQNIEKLITKINVTSSSFNKKTTDSYFG